jgi:hypothetical protein
MYELFRIYIKTSRLRVIRKSINLLVLVGVSVIKYLYIGLVEVILEFRKYTYSTSNRSRFLVFRE